MSESTHSEWVPPYTPEQLREIRKHEIRMSMEVLAEELGYSYATIQRYETGHAIITAEFVKNFEQLRARLRKAREEGDGAGHVPVTLGRRLIKLVPQERVSPEPPEIYWMPKRVPTPTEEGAPQPSAAGPTVSPQPESRDPAKLEGAFPSGRVYEKQIMRQYLTISAISVLVSVWYRTRTNSSYTKGLWSERLKRCTVVASLAMLLIPVGCLQRASSGLQSVRDWDVSQGAPDTWTGPEGSPLAAQPLPKGPVKNQKVGPCDPAKGEIEINKTCWWKLDPALPCPPGAVKHEGKCLVPVPAGSPDPYAEKK